MEKILVGLKRVVDYNVRVRVKSDGTGVETDGVKMSINPFDEIALEEALRIKERGEASEVVVVSIGGSEAQQQLRTGLAMGADRAILVVTEGETDPLTSARFARHQPLPCPRHGQTEVASQSTTMCDSCSRREASSPQ